MSNDSDETIRRRQALTDKLKRAGQLRSASIEGAFRAVPRHLFVPGIPLRLAYADQSIPTKEIEKQAVSSLSQPAIIAIMLEQLDLQLGHNVLEIGAGTGYNAALMAHIVSETGHVTTMDIDEDLVAGARAHLLAAGYGDERMTVVLGDGALGYSAFAPYDRIILTVGSTDIAPAWREQLGPDGRLVLPLDFKNSGAQFSMAFDKADDHLIARSFEPCGFIRLRGRMAQAQSTPVHNASPTVSSAFGANMMATVSQLLPKVGEQLWRRRMNRQAFGRSTLEGLRLRAYPMDAKHSPVEGEVVYDQPGTRFVIDWQNQS